MPSHSFDFSLQQMNLTCTQSASIFEARCLWAANNEQPLSYLQQKPGYYLSEQEFC
jgi:hypothetical protein